MAVLDPPGRPTAGKPRVLVDLVRRGQSLDSPLSGARWKASPATRMMTLLHGAGVRLGLVTNGERWMLVHAAPGETTSYVSFYTGLFLEEPVTLRAFQSLLGSHRLFSVRDEDTLEALFRESGQNQQEVTDQLGAQVRRAVEVLIQTFDRIDRDRNRALLGGVSETVLYEAAVTIMMRLVFLFAAEEKGLLLLGDALYDQFYAVSTLRDQLQADADAHGQEVLQRRHDAWSRLLATFRAVHGGVRHEGMRLPPYGGSLFDPDRFPFLEGRPAGSRWRDVPAHPIGVDNLTVLDLLSSLQLLEVRVPGGGPTAARRLSFRALDVEQIGHVYEGLLDHTARRATVPVLSLSGSKGKEPEIEITKLEEQRALGEDKLLLFLKEETGRSESSLKKSLAVQLSKEDTPRWQLACENDRELLRRVQPWVGMVRKDTHERPVVFGAGAVYVTEGQERRATGTHYTPKSLTEPIVQYTLEPLVYEGPADGWPKEKWKLKSARELLALRVCDMAMGSGAFLVQACRYLSERLVEAWDAAEKEAGGKLVVTPEGAIGTGSPTERPMPRNEDERLAIARRTVADRCLYGVDKNPMAVEMAKLSLWLVTLQKDRPFTFVDHALRCGDSLIGLTDPAQIEHFHLDPVRGKKLHGTLVEWTKVCGPALARAMELRKKLESFSVETVKDAEEKGRLLAEAEAALDDARLIGDLVIGAAMTATTAGVNALDDELLRASERLAAAFDAKTAKERADGKERLRSRAVEMLNAGKGPQHAERRAFHWVLDFPEVFVDGGCRGFDAFIGNPPFLKGHFISQQFGQDYREHLAVQYASGKAGLADLVSFFVVRSRHLLKAPGSLGLIATNSIAEGDSSSVALEDSAGLGSSLVRAVVSQRWPGTAAVVISSVWMYKGPWQGNRWLNGERVAMINARLQAEKPSVRHALPSHARKALNGFYVNGDGFILAADENVDWAQEPKYKAVLYPYLTGVEMYSYPEAAPRRRVILFFDWSMEQASVFGAAMARVESRVKPYRKQVGREKRASSWWLYGEPSPGLAHSLGFGPQFVKHPRNWNASTAAPRTVIAKTKTSQTWAFVKQSAMTVFDQSIVVILTEDPCVWAALQSSIHWAWCLDESTSHKTDMRYSPALFESFPEPEQSEDARRLIEQYDKHRASMLGAHKEGLTKLYNRFHDPTPGSRHADVETLRELQIQLDGAVAAAYKWDDVDLNHGFHQTKQGVRFTICEAARRRILDRLLELNHQRYEKEVAQNLHEIEGSEKPSSAISIGLLRPLPKQGALDFGEVPSVSSSSATRGRRPRKS